MSSKKSGAETPRWWHGKRPSSSRRHPETAKGQPIARWVARRGMHRPSESGKQHR